MPNFSGTLVFVVKKNLIIIATCFEERHDILFAQISDTNCDLEQENKGKTNTCWCCTHKCRLHHSVLEVVADLCQSMASLRFSYVHRFVQTFHRGDDCLFINLK